MNDELKVGGLVYYSDESIAQCEYYKRIKEYSFLGRISEIYSDMGCKYKIGGIGWKYAIKVDESAPTNGVEYKELTHHEVLDWIAKHGNTKGLQTQTTERQDDVWVNNLSSCVYTKLKYRVAKKPNDPKDPTTWEMGIKFFRKEYGDSCWILDEFEGYLSDSFYPFITVGGVTCALGKLATPELIEAWDKLNND